MKPIELPDGKWGVEDAAGTLLIGDLTSNAQAWSWIDRHPGDPLWRSKRNSGLPLPGERQR